MSFEFIGSIFALLSVILIIKQKQIAWLVVAISSLMYLIIFWQSGLYNQSVLQLFFILSAIYGFFSWGKDSQSTLRPGFGSLTHNLLFIFIAASAGWINWIYAEALFSTKIILLDSLTSVFSLLAMLLATRKKTESWIYWIIIDCFSVYLFISTGLYPTAAVYFVYILMSLWGLKDWFPQYSAAQNTDQ